MLQARSIRQTPDSPSHAWTVEQLAKETALSRSACFERFTRGVGIPPMECLVSWPMAPAKKMLQGKGGGGRT